jgi:hypothetical protein
MGGYFDKLDDWLVDGWRSATKWWSVRMNAIGVVLYPLLIAAPALDPTIAVMLPLKYRALIGGLYSLMSMLVRIYAQPKRP